MNIKKSIEKYDKSNYLNFLEHFPTQLRDACNLDIPDLTECNNDFRTIVIAGMGGSAIGGEMLQSLYCNEIPIPIHIVRDYHLPSFVNSHSLVVISSYSGNTEETISAYNQALQTGATIICITTGGTLAQLAESNGIPIVVLPKGYQPRAAIGYSLISLLRIVRNFGMITDKMSEIDETIECLIKMKKEFSPEQGKTSEPFKLAERLLGKIPVLYTGYAPFNALGTRWKCQFNENAKVLAYNLNIPESNHNEIMGWDKSYSCTDKIFAIFLRDTEESRPIARRIEITQEIIAAHSGTFFDVWATGSSILTRVFSLLYYGDYTSFYLALLNKKDPSHTDNINYLKSRLQKM